MAQISIGGFLAVVISRHLGPEAKGYSTLLTIGPSIIAWLVALGITPSTMYFASRSHDVSQLLSGSFVLAFVLGAAGMILGWFALIPGLADPAARLALVLGLVLIVVQLIREFHGAALLGLHQVALYARTALVGRVLGSAVTLAAIYLAPVSLFYLSVPISFAIANVYIILVVHRVTRWRWSWSTALLREQIR